MMSEQQPQPIKVISLYQPWASLMACGAKVFETRSWGTKYRGLVIIHASKTLEVDVLVIPLQGELKNGDEFSVTYTLPLEDNIKPKPDAQS